MSVAKPLYGASQSISISLASLGNGAARASAALDFTSVLFEDILVQITIKTAAASVSLSGVVNVYFAGSADNGATYASGASGLDSSITLSSPANLAPIGSFYANAVSTSYESQTYSVALVLGRLPAKGVVIVQNLTGAAFDATEGNHVKVYQGVNTQFV